MATSRNHRLQPLLLEANDVAKVRSEEWPVYLFNLQTLWNGATIQINTTDLSFPLLQLQSRSTWNCCWPMTTPMSACWFGIVVPWDWISKGVLYLKSTPYQIQSHKLLSSSSRSKHYLLSIIMSAKVIPYPNFRMLVDVEVLKQLTLTPSLQGKKGRGLGIKLQ